MAQTVLPQALVPGMQKDSGPVKPDPGKVANRSDSRFEAVSRAEQKRMDQKKTERVEEPRPANDSSVTTSANSESAGKPGDTGGKKKTNQTSDEVTESAISVGTPLTLTFADLQALLVPVDEQATADDTDLATGTGTGTFSMPGVFGAGVPGNDLLGEKPASQGQGLTALTLTEALAGPLTSDSSRDTDAANLLAPTRFQATLDTVSQQATKLSAESALPLKGYATSIELPVGHSDWGDKMAGKLSWLTVRGMSVAEIHLTPPDMGPMEVKVKLHHDQATVTVHAANPVVRDQLELNSHRLRDMLAEQGVFLAQFDVSDSSQQQSGEQAAGDGQGSGGQSTTGITAGADSDEGGLNAGHLDLSWKGEIDIYA